MVSAMRKVQIKCYGGSAERESPSAWPIREGFVEDVVSAWAYSKQQRAFQEARTFQEMRTARPKAQRREDRAPFQQ